MPSTGYIRVHAYTSDAQIPLQDVSVAITDPNGNPIALRLTDRSGFIEPIPITVPDRSASQTPDSGIIPYTNINIYARLENYEQIEAENVQVFAEQTTVIDTPLIPAAENELYSNKAEEFTETPQNL